LLGLNGERAQPGDEIMPNRLSYALLVVGCLAAAAGGGYLAVRQSAPASASAVDQAQPAQAPSATTEATPPAPHPAANAPAAPVAASADPAPAPAPARMASAPTVVPEQAPRRADPAEKPARRVESSRPKPLAAASRAPSGLVTPSTPLGASEWQAIEQQLPNGNPAPPRAASDAEAEAPIEQFVISSDSVIGLSLETPVSSETARVEDPVEARISRDVKVGDRVAIPAGTIVRGTVSDVERGGKLKTRARLGLQFTDILMPDGAEVPINTEAIFREGASPGDATTKKIGAGAVAGTILGAIFGGAKGALIGGATGAAGGTAVAEAGDRQPARFPAGATITVRLRAPVTVTVQK
jgi:type IV secretory pathway VirB10-like protein